MYCSFARITGPALCWERPAIRYQLFDLEDDPQELRDLADEPGLADVRQRLTDLLTQNLYGSDLEWVKDSELVGLDDQELSPVPLRNLCRQRGWR